MRRIMMAMSVVAGLAVMAAPLVSQDGKPRGERPGFARGGGAGAAVMARNPASAVLRHAEALELTPEQVRQIEAIRARVEAENAPRLEQLRAAFGERGTAVRSEDRDAFRSQMRARRGAVTAEEREAFRSRMRERREAETAEDRAELRARLQAQRAELAPVRQAIRATNRAAGQEIHAVLTAEQQAKLRATVRRDRPRPDRGERPRRGPRGDGR